MLLQNGSFLHLYFQFFNHSWDTNASAFENKRNCTSGFDLGFIMASNVSFCISNSNSQLRETKFRSNRTTHSKSYDVMWFFSSCRQPRRTLTSVWWHLQISARSPVLPLNIGQSTVLPNANRHRRFTRPNPDKEIEGIRTRLKVWGPAINFIGLSLQIN